MSLTEKTDCDKDVANVGKLISGLENVQEGTIDIPKSLQLYHCKDML